MHLNKLIFQLKRCELKIFKRSIVTGFAKRGLMHAIINI